MIVEDAALTPASRSSLKEAAALPGSCPDPRTLAAAPFLAETRPATLEALVGSRPEPPGTERRQAAPETPSKTRKRFGISFLDRGSTGT